MRTDEKINDLQAKAENLEKKIEEHSIVFEIVKKAERDKKRWFIAWLITFVLLLVVLAGAVYITTTDYEVYTFTQTTDDGGNINYAGGDINYGVPES